MMLKVTTWINRYVLLPLSKRHFLFVLICTNCGRKRVKLGKTGTAFSVHCPRCG